MKAGFTQIDRLAAADPDVDLTDRSVSHCNNPTFLDHNLKRDYLGSIAPEPPACDKHGQGPCAVRTIARLEASRVTVKPGHAVTFYGQLFDTGEPGGAPPHALVRLQRRLPHHGWTTIRIKKSTATGTVKIGLEPVTTADYRLVDAEPGSRRPVSTVVRVKVS